MAGRDKRFHIRSEEPVIENQTETVRVLLSGEARVPAAAQGLSLPADLLCSTPALN